MKVLVVDASAAIEALVGRGERAEFCRSAIASADSLAVPDLFPYEVSNVLRRLAGSGKIDDAVAARAFADLQKTPAKYWPFIALAEGIWAQRGRVSSYDAAYLTLAQKLGVPLLTTDRKLATVATHFVTTLCPGSFKPAP